MTDQEDQEMVTVIADFLEQGYVDNIIAMFKSDPRHYALVGRILRDERFAVRLGLAVLFEELAHTRPKEVEQAVPVLLPLLSPAEPAYVRGEAATILGLIGTEQARKALEPLVNDEDPQVAEIARDYTQESA